MESGEGMVAVVRGLRDSGLAVTLLDGNKQYTLMPNAAPPSLSSDMHSKHDVASQQTEILEIDQPVMCDSSAQATDGRYASMYKMSHCRIKPTSPPVQLTEFPPQRAEINRGQGNFEVGGCGSGESYTPCKYNGSFRGGMSWPDRGSVCSPRQSQQPDAFANSLRKYPNISAERSTELVERLINYTQAKHSKSYQSKSPSPSRQGNENNMSYQVADRCSARSIHRSSSYQKNYDLDTCTCSRTRNKLEESPTRDIIRPRNSSIEYDYDDYRRRNLDTNHVKDISQKVRDCIKTMNSCSYTHNCVNGRERVETSPYGQMPASVSILAESKSASIEVQAAVKMVSKEVSTRPRFPPIGGPVAVTHSSAVSKEVQKHKGEVSVQVTPKPTIKPATKCQCVQASTTGEDLSIQTNSSSDKLTNTSNACQYLNNKSKYEENITHIDLQGEIMDLLERVSVCPSVDPKASELRRKVLKRISIKLQRLSRNLQTEDDSERAKIQVRKMLKYVPVWIPFGDIQAYRDAIAEEIIYKISQFKTTTKVYRIEVPPFQIGSQPHDLKKTHDLKSTIRDWINTLPIKSFDAFGMPMDKNHMINKYVTRINKIILHKLRDVTITNDDLRKELLNFTYKIPMNVHISHKLHFLNQVIATLINRVHKIAKERINVNKSCTTINFEPTSNDNKLIRHVEKSKTKLKEIISDHLKDLFQHIIFCDELYVSYVESELIDIIFESIQDIRAGKDINVAEEIIMLLEENGITDERQAKHFVKKLLAQIKEVLRIENVNNKKCTTKKSQSYVVFQNTVNTGRINNQIPSFEDSNVNKSDKDSNTNNYIEQLTQQIDEWLQDSKMTIPYAQDKSFRQVVIHDLAGDIVDRRKYIDFNPSSRGSDEDELEHLKYQIFKWINKLAGEENMTTLDHAPELMQRIQSISVPVFTQHQNIPETEALSNGCMRPSCPQSMKISTSPSNSDRLPNQLASNQSTVNQNMSNHTTSNRRMSNQTTPNESLRKSSLKGSFTKIASPCCNEIPTTTKQHLPSPRQLNEEYDNYLKNWVKEIPIPSSTTEELELAEKARQGIYNGIWKALTKLKLDPALFHNVFYYEDAFEEELEELLKCLPDTPETKRKKHLLKVKLIEMTTKTNQMISNTAAPASFRQQLVENVENGLPTKQIMLNDDNDNSKQCFDEQQVQKLVDDYILCAKFKESNKSKAEVYRKKLIKEAFAIVENIKKIHGKEFKDINTDLYVNNILNALHKVPLPTLDILEEEANEIEMSQEIDMWFADLHVIHEDDEVVQQQTNKLKDALVKRIMDLEKEVDILDCSGEKALKHEISLFLEKVPIQDGNVNLDFIAEEFANRLKNKARESQADNIGKKSVAFLDSVGYYEFSLQMPGCSSFSEMPLRPALVDQSSYIIKNGNIEKMTSPRCLQFGPERSPEEIPSNEYLTIHDSRAHKPQPVSKVPLADAGNLQVGNPSAFNHVQPKSKPNQCCQLAGNAQFADNSQQQKIMPDIPPYQCGIQSQLATSNIPRIRQTLDQRTLNTMTQTTEPNSCCKRNNRASINLPVAPQPSYPDYMCNVPGTQAPSLFSLRIGQGLTNNNEVQQAFHNVLNSPQRHSSITPFDSEPTPNMHQSLPIIVETPDRSATYQSLEQPLNQLSTGILHTGTRNLLGNMTSYGQPQGFLTPQHQDITQDLPPRPDRKKNRRQERLRGNFAKKRLDLDDESDNASEKDDVCPCMRMWRCTREPIYYAYEDFAMERPECYPFPYSCPNLY